MLTLSKKKYRISVYYYYQDIPHLYNIKYNAKHVWFFI